MRIIEVTSQYRRDFRATIECEGCGNIIRDHSGYDDRNYHDNVMPNLKCPECGKCSNDLGIEIEKVETKYPEGFQI